MTQSGKRGWPWWQIGPIVLLGSLAGATVGIALTGAGFDPLRTGFVVAEALLVAAMIGFWRWGRRGRAAGGGVSRADRTTDGGPGRDSGRPPG